MIDGAPEIFVALEQSGFSASIRQSPWIYPAANVGHIIFLVLFAGALAVMDVRLLGGFAAIEPAPTLGRARRLAIAALAGMTLTGFVLFAAEAGHLARNPVFRLKLVLVGAGLINVAIDELWARRAVESLPAGAAIPAAARNAGLASITIWIASPLADAALRIFEYDQNPTIRSMNRSRDYFGDDGAKLRLRSSFEVNRPLVGWDYARRAWATVGRSLPTARARSRRRTVR